MSSSVGDTETKRSKQKWNKEEDEKLRQLVNSVGAGTPDWVRISTYFENRTPKQCRERWANHVSPRVEKGPWSLAEELVLFQVQALQGNRWKEIAQFLHGRSESCVKNRYYSALRRVMRRRGVEPDVAKELMKEHFIPGAERTLNLLREGYTIEEVYERQKQNLTPEYLHSEEFQPQQQSTVLSNHSREHIPHATGPGAPLGYNNPPQQVVFSQGANSGQYPGISATEDAYKQSLRRDQAQGRDTLQEIGVFRDRVQRVDTTRNQDPWGRAMDYQSPFNSNSAPMESPYTFHPRDESLMKRSGPSPVNLESPKHRRLTTSAGYANEENGVPTYSTHPFSLSNEGSSYYFRNPNSMLTFDNTPNPGGVGLITGSDAMRSTQGNPLRYPVSGPYGMQDTGMFSATLSKTKTSEVNPGTLDQLSSLGTTAEELNRISWAESLQKHPSGETAYTLPHTDASINKHYEVPGTEENGELHQQEYSGEMTDRSPDPCLLPGDQ